MTSSRHALASGEIIARACLVDTHCATWCGFITREQYNALLKLSGCEDMGRVQYIVQDCEMEWSRVVARGEWGRFQVCIVLSN